LKSLISAHASHLIPSHLNLEGVDLGKVYSAHGLGYAYHHKIFNLCVIARFEYVIHGTCLCCRCIITRPTSLTLSYFSQHLPFTRTTYFSTSEPDSSGPWLGFTKLCLPNTRMRTRLLGLCFIMALITITPASLRMHEPQSAELYHSPDGVTPRKPLSLKANRCYHKPEECTRECPS
jgi:hypothetical protein